MLPPLVARSKGADMAGWLRLGYAERSCRNAFMDPLVWRPDRATTPPPWPVPKVGTALARGAYGLCPACGGARAFGRFLKIVPVCESCHAPLGTARADDAPPYFNILIVGHIMIPLILLTWPILSDWQMAAIFLPLAAALSFVLMQPVKGAVLGVIVAYRMLEEPKPAE